MNSEKEEKRRQLLEKTKEEERSILYSSGQTKEVYDSAYDKYMLKTEPKFDKSELLCEIYVLIKEYLQGNFSLSKEEIECAFFNGQKFKIRASEVS